MQGMAPGEIKALARIVSELDYYQLLRVDPHASPREVKGAYHETSRAFHPDRHLHGDDDVREAVARIAKCVSEAYCVLRDPRRRKAYDHHLAQGSGVRLQLGEATTEGGRQVSQEREGRTAQGRQYFLLAQSALKTGDLEGAARNLQTALTFESDNAYFREKYAEIRKRLGYA